MCTPGAVAYCGICSGATYEVLCDLFRDYRVSRALVFGSFARGEQSRHSDIDLLLAPGTTFVLADAECACKGAQMICEQVKQLVCG